MKRQRQERVRRHPRLQRRRIAVGPLALDVRGTFDPVRPPVVLVHGIGVSSRYFLRLADALAPTHDVYALDLPGYGTAPRPSRPLTVPELAQVLRGAMGTLGLEAPVVVGHSMGCQVVVDAVAAAPDLCSGWVLMGPTVDPAARSLPAQAWRLLRDTLREPPATNAVIFRDYVRMGPVRYVRTARHMVRDRIEKNVHGCAPPGLVVRGERDPIAPRRWARTVAGAAPQAHLLEVPGGAHAVQHTHPQEVAAACLPFLLACRPGPRQDVPS